jgi:hypothetical protein
MNRRLPNKKNNYNGHGQRFEITVVSSRSESETAEIEGFQAKLVHRFQTSGGEKIKGTSHWSGAIRLTRPKREIYVLGATRNETLIRLREQLAKQGLVDDTTPEPQIRLKTEPTLKPAA